MKKCDYECFTSECSEFCRVKFLRWMLLLIVAVLLIFVVSYAPTVGASGFPQKAWVVDEAGKLSASAKNDLTSKLVYEEKATTNQVVVVILNNLRGDSVESYANKLARHWQIGQKGKNNGVLLLVSMKERKARIEVGYGLEHLLTDAKSKQILQQHIVPKLKAGRWDDGITSGVNHIIKTINSGR